MKAIVCTDAGDGIGMDDKLLFSFASDMKRFKTLTTDCVVVMGRKTLDTFKKALPNRINVVLTNQKYLDVPDCIFGTKEQVDLFLNKKKEEGKTIWVIGGAEIYNLYKDEIDTWEITTVVDSVEHNVSIHPIRLELKGKFDIVKSEVITEIDRISGLEKTFVNQTYVRK